MQTTAPWRYSPRWPRYGGARPVTEATWNVLGLACSFAIALAPMPRHSRGLRWHGCWVRTSTSRPGSSLDSRQRGLEMAREAASVTSLCSEGFVARASRPVRLSAISTGSRPRLCSSLKPPRPRNLDASPSPRVRRHQQALHRLLRWCDHRRALISCRGARRFSVTRSILPRDPDGQDNMDR